MILFIAYEGIIPKNFIKHIIEFKSNESGRESRKNYFENMIINTPSIKNLTFFTTSNTDYQMIGFIRNTYLDFLTEKHFIPVTKEDFNSQNNRTFYFYFYAIKNGKVYTIHKETNKAKYLRLTNTDINECKVEYGYKFQHLLPWEAEIHSIELVSKDTLIEKLNNLYGDNQFTVNNTFHADFYYLVKATITRFCETGVSAINTTENDDISIYSPKIVKRVM